MFLHPLGLLALLGVPAVLGLHLFRRRYRPHTVSALFLWDSLDRAATAGRRRERLRRSPSLWAELVCATLLGLAFAGPRFLGIGETAHLVCVVDASASMGSVVDGVSQIERVRDELRERIGRLPSSSRVTIVQSGPRPRVLAGPAAFPAEARESLSELEPLAPRHDLRAALALGQKLAGEGAVVLFTDEYRPDDHPEKVHIVAVGESADNVGIVHAVRTRDEDGTGERAYLTVQSFARGEVRCVLAIEADGAELERRELRLAPDQRAHLAFDLPPGSPAVHARLSDDALALDNVAVLAPTPPRTLALHADLSPATARALGLAGRGAQGLERWLSMVPDSIAAGSRAAAHLVVTDRPVADEEEERAWTLVVGPQGEGDARAYVGPFLVEKRHPAVRGITLEGVVWSAGAGPVPGAPLVSAGNLPLLTEERREGQRIYRLNVDPRKSSLARTPDWPILLANLARERRAELPGPAATNLQCGQDFHYHSSGRATWTLRGPDGAREFESRGSLVIEGLGRPGLYRLEREGRELCRIGVSFADARESDLRGLSSGRRERAGGPGALRASFTWIEAALLAAALAALLADWFVLKREGTRVPGVAEDPS